MTYSPLPPAPIRDRFTAPDRPGTPYEVSQQWQRWLNQLTGLVRSIRGYQFAVTTTGVAANSTADVVAYMGQPVPSDAVVTIRAPALPAGLLVGGSGAPTATGGVTFRIANVTAGSLSPASTGYAASVVRTVTAVPSITAPSSIGASALFSMARSLARVNLSLMPISCVCLTSPTCRTSPSRP